MGKIIIKSCCSQLIRVMFIFLYSLIMVNKATILNPQDPIQVNSSCFGIHYSQDTLLAALKNEKFQNNTNVRYLLDIFETLRVKRQENTQRAFPFFVIDGYFTTRRKLISKIIATSIGAKVLIGFPSYLRKIQKDFLVNAEEKVLFYSVALYVVSYNLQNYLQKSPVVLTGYWMVYSSHNIAKTFPDSLPPVGSNLYKFPNDLIKPDLYFYVSTTVSMDSEYPNDAHNFILRVNEVYSRIRDPKAYAISTPYFREEDLIHIKKFIRKNISPKFNHLYTIFN